MTTPTGSGDGSGGDVALSESQIAVHWREEEYIEPPEWFVGGRLNACVNCVDRHLETSADKPAFIWVPEPEDEETQEVTSQDLYNRVNEFAALLEDVCGVETGDRVTFHLPMLPELPVSMF